MDSIDNSDESETIWTISGKLILLHFNLCERLDAFFEFKVICGKINHAILK